MSAPAADGDVGSPVSSERKQGVARAGGKGGRRSSRTGSKGRSARDEEKAAAAAEAEAAAAAAAAEASGRGSDSSSSSDVRYKYPSRRQERFSGP